MLEALRQLRKTKGVTMKDVGAVIGVSEATVSLYERGLRSPSYEVLLKLGEYFDVSVDYLLNGTDAPTISETDDDSHGLAKAQQALTKAIEQNSDLPSKERISLLFDASDYDPMVIAFNLDFDQDYLTRWMVYGDIPPAPIVNKILGVFQIKPKDLLDLRDLKAYEDEQKEWPILNSNAQAAPPNIGQELLNAVEGLSEADQRLILAVLKRMKESGESRGAVQTERGPYYLYSYSDGHDIPPHEADQAAPPVDAPGTPPEGE